MTASSTTTHPEPVATPACPAAEADTNCPAAIIYPHPADAPTGAYLPISRVAPPHAYPASARRELFFRFPLPWTRTGGMVRAW